MAYRRDLLSGMYGPDGNIIHRAVLPPETARTLAKMVAREHGLLYSDLVITHAPRAIRLAGVPE